MLYILHDFLINYMQNLYVTDLGIFKKWKTTIFFQRLCLHAHLYGILLHCLCIGIVYHHRFNRGKSNEDLWFFFIKPPALCFYFLCTKFSHEGDNIIFITPYQAREYEVKAMIGLAKLFSILLGDVELLGASVILNFTYDEHIKHFLITLSGRS